MTHPQNLDEVVDYLYEQSGEETLMIFGALSEQSFIKLVKQRWAFNILPTWDLKYNVTPIAQWFTNIGVTREIDRERIIMRAFYCKVKNIPFSLEPLLSVIKEYWQNEGFKDGIPPIFADEASRRAR